MSSCSELAAEVEATGEAVESPCDGRAPSNNTTNKTARTTEENDGDADFRSFLLDSELTLRSRSRCVDNLRFSAINVDNLDIILIL